MLEMLYGWDIRPDLPQITAPTLIVHRRDSRAFPPSNGRDLAAGIAGSRAVIVDGFAHFPPEPGDPHTIDVVNEILGFVADGAKVVPVRDQPGFHSVLFTDVEGSADLFEQLGDKGARNLLRAHDQICREAVAAQGGREIKATGDGFMFSFSSASSALDAAISMQRAMEEQFAKSDTPIRIRVGIHAGEPIQEDEDLHGTAVIRSARIMGTGEGGQIMVSSIVRELVAGKSYRFINRGMHELKGVDEEMRLFELVGEDPAP